MSQDDSTPGRRDFLKAASLVGLGAAATLPAIAADPDTAMETPDAQIKTRYSLTPHVQRFYFLNRL